MGKPCNSVVRARIDAQTKYEATEALEAVGLSISEYIRLSLTKIAAEKTVPFEVGEQIDSKRNSGKMR